MTDRPALDEHRSAVADLLVKLYGALPAAAPAIAELHGRGIRVRRAMPLDRTAISAWLSAQQDAPSIWRGECEAALARQPCTCFVATELGDGTARGYAQPPERLLGIACWDATARGFFGPEVVAASERGRGIGRVLLIACLQAMRDEGYGYAVIGWAGPKEFYRRTVGAIEIPDSEPGVYPPRLV